VSALACDRIGCLPGVHPKEHRRYVENDGSIRTYEYASFNLDNIATGRQLLTLYRTTGEEKYRIAADTLRKQLAHHPRTHEGGSGTRRSPVSDVA